MGSVTFLLPDNLSAAELACLPRAALAGGYDATPVPTRHTRSGKHRLTLTRDTAESGFALAPWPLTPAGVPAMCATGTLREREEPYHLLVELARGRLNQVRTQAAEWEQIGLELSPEARAGLKATAKLFGQAVLDPGGAGSADAARQVLVQATRHAEALGAAFARQLLKLRKLEPADVPAKLGCRLEEVPAAAEQADFLATFGAVKLVPNWGAIEPREASYQWAKFDALVEWSVKSGRDVTIGPIIDLADGPFPEWVQRAGGDLPTIAAFYCDFVEQVVTRYQRKVRSWQACAGFNHADRFGLGEDDRIRLAARLLEAGKQLAPDARWTLSLAQLWGDYLVSDEYTYSPLVFADTLVRAGCHFTAVELELLAGPGPRSAPARDPVALYRLLSLFGMLSIPLELVLGQPLDAGEVDHVLAPISLACALPQVQAVTWEAWDASSRVPGAALRGHAPLAQAVRLRLQELRG